jgi:hypothetical protein
MDEQDINRQIEIRFDESYSQYELWEVFYNSKEKLYPVLYENFVDFDLEEWVMELVAKHKFPDMPINRNYKTHTRPVKRYWF